MPIQFIPNSAASIAVVLLPINGSKTVLPSSSPIIFKSALILWGEIFLYTDKFNGLDTDLLTGLYFFELYESNGYILHLPY